MTRRIKKREFDPTLPVYVGGKGLRDSGVLLPEGTEFDWKRSSLSVRRVVNLFNAGYLRHEKTLDPVTEAQDEEAAAAKAAEEAAAAKAAEEAAAAEADKAAKARAAEANKTSKEPDKK
jgi:multidrug resistance efflux pump